MLEFLGLPFAAPAVGERRFSPPAPVAPWSDEREALSFGPAPPQHADPLAKLLGIAHLGPEDEDCLTLNIWTPGADSGRRPVLVWIHGGAFISGASGAAVYDGARLSARGDVVVVTFNYRVGVLGYLHLDGSEGSGGPRCTNLGLLDQIAALTWVRDNVAAFGGDPERVTVFGESAGAGSVCALIAAPAARGLLHAAIVQSAAPDGFLTVDEARERSARLLEVLGSGPASLQRLSTQELLAAAQTCARERRWKTGMFFTPVIDGEILPARPMAAIRDGVAAPVPVLVGTTRDELQLFKHGAPEPDAAAVEATLGARVYEVFGRARKARGESLAGIDLVFAFHTEVAMRGPAIRMAEHHARARAATFMYLFDWSSGAEGGLGSHHALDVPFCFGTLDAPGVAAYAGSGELPERISAQMMDAWIAFARTGRPSTEALGSWPEYDEHTRATMILGAEPRVVEAPREPERAAVADLVRAMTP